VRLLTAGDPNLQRWAKQTSPFLSLPPPNLPLTGWRDPFVIQRGESGKDWIILMGSGLKEQGGTTLIYRARELAASWDYAGLLCLGDPSQGAMWECPLLWRIPAAPNLADPGFADGAGGLQRAGATGQLEATSAIAVASGTDIFGSVSVGLQVPDSLPPAPLLPCVVCFASHHTQSTDFK
jgi:sucrose-6-phosphate hydrolase SacC (GH32 family)